MAAKYILVLLAVIFLLAAARRLARDRTIRHPQTRTWLLVASIFFLVSGFLFWRR